MLSSRQLNIIPPAHMPDPTKPPLPSLPGLSFPAASIQTSLRWQRLLAGQEQALADARRPRLERMAPRS